jgi:hypothetical protein
MRLTPEQKATEAKRIADNRSHQTAEQKASEAKRVADRRSDQTADQYFRERKRDNAQHQSAYENKTPEQKAEVRYSLCMAVFLHLHPMSCVQMAAKARAERKKFGAHAATRPDDPICSSCCMRVPEVVRPRPAARQHFIAYRTAYENTEIGRLLGRPQLDRNDPIPDALGPNVRSYVAYLGLHRVVNLMLICVHCCLL